MSNLSRGESSKDYARRALQSAANKTEGEKLFASLATEGSTPESRREIIGKLYAMFPDGAMLGTFYVNTRATPEERFTAAQEYIKKFPDQPSMYNTIAYYYMLDKKDLDMAKQNLEKYMSMYPDGCNPYDSMGEYYLNAGDTTNAEKYYKMALEKYPFFNSSINALQKIEAAKKQ
jgi:TolA-binding protein